MRLADRFLFALLLAALAPAAAAQQPDWARWYAGAALGLGLNAHYRQDGRTLDFDQGMQNATDKSTLGAFNVEGGIRLDPKTLVGVQVSGVGKSSKINGNDASTSIGNYFAMLTYFPAERGFFMRVGGGYAAIVIDDGTDRRRTGGLGVQGGLGWAWNLLSNHYLTLAVDQSFQFYHSNSNGRPTRSEFSAVYLGYMYRH
jgi:outer membrane protein with beta-barrel domain